MSLGKNIRERRKALGLTQEGLGEKLGMAAQTVSKWERDESMPDAALLPPLADALGCSLDSLFDRKTTRFADAANASKDWLLTLTGRDRWLGALRLGRILQTALGRFWEHPAFQMNYTVDFYDNPISVTGLITADEGFTFSSRDETMPFFVLCPEPEAGWGPLLEEDAPEFWEILAKEPVRRAIRRIYAGELPDCFDREWALGKGGLDSETLADLEALGMLTCEKASIDGQEGELLYPRMPLRLLTFLLLSTLKSDDTVGFSAFSRTVPYLRRKDNESPEA